MDDGLQVAGKNMREGWREAAGGEKKRKRNWAKGDWAIVLGLEGLGLNRPWF